MIDCSPRAVFYNAPVLAEWLLWQQQEGGGLRERERMTDQFWRVLTLCSFQLVFHLRPLCAILHF